MTDTEFLNRIFTWKHNSSTNSLTLTQIRSIDVSTFVDVGPGDGYYGKLVKYVYPDAHTTGVEMEPTYVQKWNLKNIYNEVINSNVLDVIDKLSGDLIIFGDVLEHLEKEEMVKVLSSAINNFKYIIVNSPVGFQPQNHEIKSEIHRCGITKDDFVNYNVLSYNEFDNNIMFNCFIKGNLS